jgi:Protein of unknown function (DUF3631)
MIDEKTANNDILTWILDEADETLLEGKDNADYNRLLNNGTSRGKVIVRANMNDITKTIETKAYCPKAIGGLSITRLKATTRSRTLTIPMRPAKLGEYYRRHIDKETAVKLRADIEDSHSTILGDLRTIDEDRLSEFINRKSQILNPLLALAKLGGDDWFKRAVASVELVVYRKQTKDRTDKETVFQTLFDLYNTSRFKKYKTGIQLHELAQETRKDVDSLKEYFGENGYDIHRSQINHKLPSGKWDNQTGLKWVDCERRFVDYGLLSYDNTGFTDTTENGETSPDLHLGTSTDFTSSTRKENNMEDEVKVLPIEITNDELIELERLYGSD